MVEFIDTFLQKRRPIIAVTALIITILLISLPASTLQTRRAKLAAQVQVSAANQPVPSENDSPNLVTDALSQVADDAGRAKDTIGLKTLSGVVGVAADTTHYDKDIVQGGYTATVFTFHGIGYGVATTVHAAGDVVTFTGHTIGAGFSLTGHAFGRVFGLFSGVTHVSSLIKPTDHTPTPTITQLRAQQVSIIQSGTQGVAVTPTSNGAGGDCDSGEGNGGYPMSWCNAPMDSVRTISYSGDSINRECTSYAYWYFTSIEGRTDFRVSGNAKYWANSSNYPTYAAPAVGAIAVETAGAYGHVAIVQALPGQRYAGQIVPAGYVLVSEMNYDWNGHFRYSYSPVGKFTRYIYP